jgi:hypothetical protein
LGENSNYTRYSKETAICVGLALDAIEADIKAEIAAPEGAGGDALRRVLEKLRQRRNLLMPFTEDGIEAASRALHVLGELSRSRPGGLQGALRQSCTFGTPA